MIHSAMGADISGHLKMGMNTHVTWGNVRLLCLFDIAPIRKLCTEFDHLLFIIAQSA